MQCFEIPEIAKIQEYQPIFPWKANVQGFKTSDISAKYIFSISL